VTRKQQLIALTPTLNLLDTPGFLWPKLEPVECGHRLAISGAVKDVAFDYEDMGLTAVDLLQRLYPSVLTESFGLPKDLVGVHDPDVCERILTKIAQDMGCLKKAGIPNLEQAGRFLVKSIRKAKYGRITLETPEMIILEGGVQGKLDGVHGVERRKRLREEKRRLRREKRKNSMFRI
jgi:ribosome biogenesis GTPase A